MAFTERDFTTLEILLRHKIYALIQDKDLTTECTTEMRDLLNHVKLLDKSRSEEALFLLQIIKQLEYAPASESKKTILNAATYYTAWIIYNEYFIRGAEHSKFYCMLKGVLGIDFGDNTKQAENNNLLVMYTTLKGFLYLSMYKNANPKEGFVAILPFDKDYFTSYVKGLNEKITELDEIKKTNELADENKSVKDAARKPKPEGSGLFGLWSKQPPETARKPEPPKKITPTT